MYALPTEYQKNAKETKAFSFQMYSSHKTVTPKKTEQNEIVFKSFVQLILCEIQHKKILEQLY